MEGLPPVGEAVLRYYQLPLTREARYKLVLRGAQQSPRTWVRVREDKHQSLEDLSTFAFSRTRTTTNDAGTDSENELAPR